MHQLFRTLFISLLLISSSVFAQQQPTWSASLSPEERIVAQWAYEHSGRKTNPKTIERIVHRTYLEAEKHGVDALTVFSIIWKESRFDPKATSVCGAKGLMQVLPKYHRAALAGRSPYSVDTSIEVGTKIYAEYLSLHRTEHKAMSRYSGGARNYHRNVVATRKALQREIVVSLFNQPPVQRSQETWLAMN